MNCGCNPPLPTPYEFKIIDDPLKYINSNVKLPNSTDRERCLIKKIVGEYLDIINKLECGIQPDIENLLQEISLIDMKNGYSFSVTKQIYSSIPQEEDYLKKSQYLSEFKTPEEKKKVLSNLGLDGMKHIVLSKYEYDQLDEYDEDAIYFITD